MRLAALFAACACLGSGADVIWDTPSRDSSGSMPLGNGDIGINLWVEPSGDVVFYIGKTDAWSENIRLLKLGRVRLRLEPNPLAGAAFRQHLRIGGGEIEIREGAARILVWVDANQPVIRIEARAPREFEARATLEMWRNQERRLEGQEAHSAYGLDGGPEAIVVTPDTVLPEQNGRIVWCHRNQRSAWPGILRHQGLGELIPKLHDPVLHRTFGGAIVQSPGRARRHLVSVHLLTAQTASADEWVRMLGEQIRRVDAIPFAQARRAHLDWWAEFWGRSWIRVSGSPEAEMAGRSYALQRFINAAGGRGAYPIKFNGSIFTVDAREPKQNFDADYRRWGGPYWFQNTRLPYWSMLAAGDYDLMEPLFRMYREALPLARARTRIYFSHAGAFFPETMYFFGAYANSNYGWERAGRHPSFVENTYIRYYYSCGLELVALMLEAYEHRPDRVFLRETLLPLADEILTFYDEHYLLGSDGKIRLEPAQALETWQKAVNPLPEIAGLHYVLGKLLWVLSGDLAPAQRERWEQMLGELPPIPVEEAGDGTRLLPAEQVLEKARNTENAELYAVFPYRLYGVGKPGLEVGRATFENRFVKDTAGGWRQDPIQAAYLGLASVARDYIVRNFAARHTGSRFPAFWGPNFDWVPDQCHGTAQMIALQAMLLQADYGKIHLFPAWPKEWDVEFRLRAPGETVVDGIWRGGKLERLRIMPEWRGRDVVQHEPQ